MTAPVFILPTSGATSYRGKYPGRARTVSAGTTGLHVELNDGTRLWTARGADHFADLPRVNADLSAFAARAVPMTAEQYKRLSEAADLLRQRAQIAGHGRRARLESDVRAIVESILPDDSAYAKRNAEARRREVMAETSARLAFDPAKPFRVYNRGPWGSTCFDFATADEARAYLSAQAEARRFATSGAAPAGPHGDSIDPLQSFIVSPDGTETLADLGWTPPAEGERLWNRPAPATADEAKPEPAGTIDLTPTWAGMGATLRMLADNGDAEGQATAWAEIGKALRLADERNAMATALSNLATVLNETGALESIGPVGDMCRDEADLALEAAWEALTGEPRAARFRFDFDRLSGTGILVRLSDDKTSARYTGDEAERLSKADAAALHLEAMGQEFS